MRVVMRLVVVVVNFDLLLLANRKRTCVIRSEIGRVVCQYRRGRAYAQILTSTKLLLGFRFGNGDGGIFDHFKGEICGLYHWRQQEICIHKGNVAVCVGWAISKY